MTAQKISKSVAIVTGISRGFGLAVAHALLAKGWQVVGDGRSTESLKKVQANLGPGAILIAGNVTNEAHLIKLVDTARSLGQFKLLVNNAGILGPSPMPVLLDLKINDLESVLKINTLAPLRLIQIAAPSLAKIVGVVINVTSDAAVKDYEGWGAYSITKAALEKLTAILALEQKAIRFYCLDPGDMQTDMHQAAYPGEDISDRQNPNVSAPAVVRLAKGDLPSGRYRVADLLIKRQA